MRVVSYKSSSYLRRYQHCKGEHTKFVLTKNNLKYSAMEISIHLLRRKQTCFDDWKQGPEIMSKYSTFCHTSSHSMMLCMVVPSSFSCNVPTIVVLCSTLPVSSNFSRLVLTPALWMITVLYISGVSVKNEITVKIFVEKRKEFWLSENVSPWDC